MVAVGAATGASARQSGWRQTFHTLGAFALACAIMAAGVIVGSVSDRLIHGRSAPGGVPDTLIQMTYDQQARQQNIVAYRPGTNTPHPLLDGGSEPIVTPDGTQIVFTQQQQVGDVVRYAVVTFASGSLAQQWRTEIATGPVPTQQTFPITLSAEVTADRVYVASHQWQSADPVTITALDRANGRERARWSVDIAGKQANALSLRAAPDGSSLALMANLDIGPGVANIVPRSLFLRFRLPDGQETQRLPITQTTDAAFYFLSSPIAPDGRTLYQLSYGSSPTSLVLRFFDFQQAAALPPLALPFAEKEDFLAYEQAISHDGQRLYVLVPTQRALYVVNLMTRRIEEQVQVDTSAVEKGKVGNATLFGRVFSTVRGLFVRDVGAKGPLLGAMQLSPDGRTLYAAGATGQSHATQSQGIWLIDTRTWHVTKQWLPDASPTALLLSADGKSLSIQADRGGIRTLDTASGNEVGSVGGTANGFLYSLPERYRARYGKSPGMNVRPRDIQTAPPFATLAASVDRATIVAGDTVTIGAQFMDPNSGAPISPSLSSARYEPPATVTALLCRYGPNDCGQPTSLMSVGYGQYRGNITPAEAGNWSLQVLATWNRDDVPNRQARMENAVTVQPAFTGTDGKRYIATVTTNPAQPTVKQTATVRVAFVDAARGMPLPEVVELLGGLPTTMQANFYANGNAGFTLHDLQASGHGIYTGDIIPWASGSWRVDLSVPIGNGVTTTVTVGAMRVSE